MKRTLIPEAFERVTMGPGQRRHSISKHCTALRRIALLSAVAGVVIAVGGCATLEPHSAPVPAPVASTSPSPSPEVAEAYELHPGEVVEGPVWTEAAAPEPVPLPEEVNLDASGAPSLWPVADANAPVLSWFGVRRSAGGSGSDIHKGIDIKGPAQMPILAAADGVVKFSGNMRGYGQLIVVDHGGGFETAYGHLCRRSVGPGDPVKVGDTLGLMGATGNASAVHLHYEVRYQGKPLDPNWFLPAQ